MTVELHEGDCLEVLRGFADASIDAIVTDPPYGLTNASGGPHGKGAETPYARAKAGASSGGFMGLKWDADVPNVEVWVECLRVLKPGGYLLAFAGTRTQHRMAIRIEEAGFEIRDIIAWVYGTGFPKSHNGPWGGTALKPALEPITVARKPLVGTVEANWKEHGTGALNITACRIAVEDADYARNCSGDRGHAGSRGADAEGVTNLHAGGGSASSAGRWPANLIHDGSDEVIARFPAMAGAAAPVHRRNADKFRNAYGAFKGNVDEAGSTFHADTGSAARFFYCAKASKADRGSDNLHPTVKPTDLMRYLCRLVTPAGGVVLDPFMGSGSTGKAAVLEGFRFIGIEREAEYVAIARARITAPPTNPQDQQPDLFGATA